MSISVQPNKLPLPIPSKNGVTGNTGTAPQTTPTQVSQQTDTLELSEKATQLLQAKQKVSQDKDNDGDNK